VLELVDVHAYYGESHVLQGVDMRVGEGEVVTLLGRNGVGKTTTMRTIIGLTRQTGSVKLAGTELSALPAWKRSRAGLALVPEDRRIIEGLTVEENLRVAVWAATRKGTWDLEKVWRHFPRLKERRKQIGTSMSGGEQQMLAIARAALSNPTLLLLDEPSQGLAPALVGVVRQIIRDLHASGMSVLLVEQNLSMALALSNRAYVINKGRIVYEGPCAEFSADKDLGHRLLGVS
jgi:branched-chain amino acid transport system ATP-binding protein